MRSGGQRALAVVAAAASMLGACKRQPGKAAAPPESQQAIAAPVTAALADAPPSGGSVHVEMVNVNIHLDAELILHIRRLSGNFVPTRKGQPVSFDDKRSYVVAIDSGEIGVSTASMSHAMNTYVFNAPDAPLKNLSLSVEGGEIKQTGKLTKGPGIPFETRGTMSATADGKIRIHSSKVKAAHLPVGGVMKLLGLNMGKVLGDRKPKGITADGNDIILDPAQMLPPPVMRGRITAVRLEGDLIVQTFGSRKPDALKQTGNFMAYRGGVLRFGRMTMDDADMQLIDSDASDAFDFFPDHYLDQLVAGYSKTTVTGGLMVFMPDYNKLGKRAGTSPSGKNAGGHGTN